MKKFNLSLLFVIIFTIASSVGFGQTNPTAQTLPYSQNFSSLTGTSPVYPSGWQGWTISGSLGTSFSTAAPNGNQAISVVTNGTTTGHVGDYIGKIGMLSTSSAIKSIVLSINTTGKTSIQVIYDAMTQRTENTRQSEMGVQYRIGTSGTFTNLSSGQYQNQMLPTNTTGTTSVNIINETVNLPVACEDQAVVQIRWIIRDVSGSGNRPGFAIDNISVTGSSAMPTTVNISSPTISPGNVDQGALNCILMRYDLAVTNANAILNGLTLTTGGSYTNEDVTNFKVRYSNDVVLDNGDATLSTYTNTGSAGTIVFPSFTNQTITSGTTGYVFITADISSTATEGNYVSISTTPFSNISFSGTVTKTGTDPVAAGGSQTFQSVVSQVALSSSNPSVIAGNVVQKSTNNVIYSFNLTVDKANATLSGLKINTLGTYSPSDISNLKVWYSSDNTFSAAGDVLLSTLSNISGPGEQAFSDNWTNQVFTNGTTGYIFVTADISCSAVLNHTIYVDALTTSDITFANADLSGSAYPSEAQTIQLATPNNASALSISSPSSSQETVTWTNPTGCFDEVMIVVSTATISEVPTGNGSAYTANLTYGNGTGFGGGYVVYKGSSSPQVVSGLTIGNTYYFKVFTRNGNIWSAGIEASSYLANYIAAGSIYISHLSADYNNASDEFVVLFNNTPNPIDLNGYELKYFAASGATGGAGYTFMTTTNIQPYSHLLLSPNTYINVGTVVSKARDLSFSAGMSTNGQLVLRQTSNTSNIIFAVAWGTISTYVAGMTNSAPWNGDGMISLTPNGTTYIYNNANLDFVFSNISYTHTVSDSIKNVPSSIDSTLPVHLSSLNSTAIGRDVRITWTTESEINNSGFDIERKSADGNWSKVGFVKGNGTTNSNSNYDFTDKKLNSGKYDYRLKQIDNNGNYTYYKLQNTVVVGIPDKFNLSQNYPNPFNPVTKIDFDLPRDGKVRLVVYDMIGREVKTLISGELKTAGFYSVELNALNLSSGTYFYRMIVNSQNKDYIFTKKMTVIK